MTDDLKSASVMEKNLSAVIDAFVAAEISYSEPLLRDPLHRRVTIAERDREKALHALRSKAGPGLYVSRINDGDALLPIALERSHESSMAKKGTWEAYHYWTVPESHVLHGRHSSCIIEFGTGTVVATTKRESDSEVREGSRHPIEKATFPVDVVYTWVDGQDPLWIAKRDNALGASAGAINVDGSSSSRWNNRDELKFSLRSLERFADFVRNVYLVTDDQIPEWHNEDGPLKIVSHKELFGGEGMLPTFNSHAIEARLHHIDGLSEHYLYCNDDVSFGRRVLPEIFFFANGISKFFLSKALIAQGPPSAHDDSVTSAAKNGRDLLARDFGVLATNKMKHVPHPQRRGVLFEMEERYPAEFQRVWNSQFRSPADLSIASSLSHHYSFLTGRAVPSTIRYQYVNLNDENLEGRLRTLLAEQDFDTWCLNDTDDASGSRDSANLGDIVKRSLERAFPLKSRFER